MTSIRVYYSDHLGLTLPPGHRFPLAKYALLRRTLIEREILTESLLHPSPLAELEDLVRVHDTGYVQSVLRSSVDRAIERRIGLPCDAALARRSLGSVGGTVAATEQALSFGFGANLAGGTHHARFDVGAGYCVFNDIAIAAAKMLSNGRIGRALVIDLDVHQGDGTALLFADEARVFTFSMHGARNFPFRKVPSSLDVALPDGTTDSEYLDALDTNLSMLLEWSDPDIIFYQAGVDPLSEDSLGRMDLTQEGLRERDRRIFELATTAELPLVLTLGGGYAKPIEKTVEAHCKTYELVREFFG